MITVPGDDAPEAEMISHDQSSQLSRDDAAVDGISRALARLQLGEADTCISDQHDIERQANRLNPGAETTM